MNPVDIGVRHLAPASLLVLGAFGTSACSQAPVPFQRDAWLADGPDHAGAMVDDLIANHLKVGMTKDQVEELLGWEIADDKRWASEDVGAVPSKGSIPGCCHLVVEFDDAGLLTVAYLGMY